MNNPTARFNALMRLKGWDTPTMRRYVCENSHLMDSYVIEATSLDEAARMEADKMGGATRIWNIPHRGKRFVIRHLRSGRTVHCTVRAEKFYDRAVDATRSAASFRLPHERRAGV